MKSGRVKAASFAAALKPLVVLVTSLMGAVPSLGLEVQFAERVISTEAIGAFSVFAVDFDGDGDIDVLSASTEDDKIAWYENNGDTPPTFTERVISTSADGASSVYAIDLNGDGNIDVVSASINDDKIAWYESDGGTPPAFTERWISTIADAAISVFAINLDGDGDIDVLSASFLGDKIAWHESDGGTPPIFTERVISNTANGARSVFAADVDGDGDIDVLAAIQGDDKIVWYESDGGSPPTFTERLISSASNNPHFVFAADVDGDGDLDVLSASNHDNKIAWHENDGGSPPTFTERVISTTANGAWSVFAMDLDGDGDIDVLSAAHLGSRITWYESSGGLAPVFTERVISTTALHARSVFAADVDGDGDVDVLSASWLDSKIAWYENTTCGDGVIEGTEECDDLNGDAGDGCSATCDVEPASKCTGEPSVCVTGIPAVSQWGLLFMGLLVLVAGTIMLMRGRRACA